MRAACFVAAALALAGCHSGMVGPAISGSVSVLAIINQDWVGGQLDFLKVGPPKATPASATTPAAH